jgi:hypothetical protein
MTDVSPAGPRVTGSQAGQWTAGILMWPRPAADVGGHADPATPLQYGWAVRLFEQLGCTGRGDRLGAAAALLGLDGLESFKNLT